jgi:hypothetical protein
MKLEKLPNVDLRSVGLNEKWLQERIKEDTSILGLGELEIVGREHQQPSGGRIDFLMCDQQDEIFYEVEVMLGTLNESHIIRSIEYWDIERQRRPQFTHRAVIVAEDITSIFFNVLRLLNRAVPIIAIKLGAFRTSENSVTLHAVKVLDVVEEIIDSGAEPAEAVDRGFWEKRTDAAASIDIMDKIVSLLRSAGIEPRLTYNRYHIAMGTTGYNFCWFHPRKKYCSVAIRVNDEIRDSIVSNLQSRGIDASPKRTHSVTFNITQKGLGENSEAIVDALKEAERARGQ